MVRVQLSGDRDEVFDLADFMAQRVYFDGFKLDAFKEKTGDFVLIGYTDGIYKRRHRKAVVDVDCSRLYTGDDGE